MPAADVVYRDAQARLHRLLGSYLAIVAWKSGCDCIILERDKLLPFLGLEKMKNARIDWLKEDLRSLFPICHTTTATAAGTYADLYLSRKTIPNNNGVWASMTTQKRVDILAGIGITATIIGIPGEKELVTKMALLSAGLESL